MVILTLSTDKDLVSGKKSKTEQLLEQNPTETEK